MLVKAAVETRRLPLVAASAAALFFVSSAAFGQAAISPNVPADRPDQTSVAPGGAPTVRTNSASHQPATPNIRPFRLTRVDVDGSSLPASVLREALAAMVGQDVDGSRLAQISAAVIEAYRRSDIALYTVLVPQQDFAGGALRIHVVEGYIQDVIITGAQAGRERRLAARYLNQMKAERPLRRSTLQRYLSLTRDIPGLRPSFDLTSAGTDGAVRLTARIEPDHIQFGAAANNRGTSYLGRTQLSADLYLNNLVGLASQTRLTLAAPTDLRRFQYVALSHNQLVDGSGTTVQISAGYLSIHPAGANLDGHATTVAVQASHPLIRSFESNLNLTIGVDGLDAQSLFLGSRYVDDHSRALRAGAAYSYESPRINASLSAAASFGLEALGARTLNPAATDLSFTKLNGRLSVAAELFTGVILRGAAVAQWSHDRLPGAEQLALGGNEFGRGYEAAVITGDRGYAGSLELAYRPNVKAEPFDHPEPYIFVDGGEVWYAARLTVPTNSASLGSAGLGVRSAVGSHVAVQLEATRALPNRLAPLNRQDWRGIFAIRTLW